MCFALSGCGGQATGGDDLFSDKPAEEVENETTSKIAITGPLPSNAVNSTNNSAFVVQGNCETGGSSVVIQLGSLNQSVSCSGGQFAFTFDASALADGSLQVRASQTDVNGVLHDSSFNIVKDVIAPSVTGISDDANPTNSKDWSWGCSESSCNFRFIVDQSSGTNPAGAFNSASSTTQNSGNGTFFVHVQAQDAAGNTSTVVQGSAVLDTTAPSELGSVSLETPASSPNTATSITIQGTGVTVGDTVRVYTDSSCSTEVASSVAIASDVDVSVNVPSDGAYQYFALIEDSAGNRSGCSSPAVDYVLDTSINTPSAIALISPASSPANDSTPTVRVSGVESGDNISLFSSSNCFGGEQIGFAQASGSTVDVTISSSGMTSDGSYQIFAKSVDAAGNVSACSVASLSYDLDTTPPSSPSSVTLIDPASSPSTDTTPTFRVAGLSVGDTVKVFSDASCEIEVSSVAVSSANEDITVPALSSDGAYSFFAASMDVAGNTSACSATSASYTLDSGVPTLTSVSISASGGGNVVGVGGTAWLTFTASEPLQTQTVTIDGQAATVTLLSGNTYRAEFVLGGGNSPGALPFTIDFTDSNGNAGVQVTTTTDGSSLSFDNTDNSPQLSIANQNVDEGQVLSLDINDSLSGNDQDADGDAITYSCFFDTIVDGTVAQSSACSGLVNGSFDTTSGQLGLSPNFTQAGLFEVMVIANEGNLQEAEIFTLTVNNINRLPQLSSVSSFDVNLDDDINVNVNDVNTGNDTDLDGETITYSCFYDDVEDSSVASVDSCTDIAGLNFDENSGSINWQVKASNVGFYEIKIVGSDGSGSGDTIFTVDVLVDVSKLKQISMVGSGTNANIVSLGDNNVVTLNGNPVAGSPFSTGTLFNVSTTAGDVLECTDGCFAVTPVDGTAAWTAETYASTLLSTYMGRNLEAKLVVAAFDQDASISIQQASGEITSGTVTKNSVSVFTFTYSVGALWVQSDNDISAYISTSTTDTGGSGPFDRDGRVMTAASKQGLAFVSGGGGTPSGISTTTDNTTVSVYRNDGTNFIDQIIDISDILTVTSSTSQNPAAAAISIEANQPVVSTQHADGDGTNATPSLPKSMLPTSFITPMDGDYVSFASYESGSVRVVDASNTITSVLSLTRDPSAHSKAPFAATYNIANIPAGTRFECTSSCLGIFEPLSNDDETLMTGTIREFDVTSTSFTQGGSIPASFKNSSGGSCSGDNDFPQLAWEDVPWGTKSFAVVVEDTSNSDFVHLNIFDIAASESGIPFLDASGGSVTFPSGTLGNNGNGNAAWEGPCPSGSASTVRFKVYALNSNLGASMNNMTTSAFEAAFSTQILGSTEISGQLNP